MCGSRSMPIGARSRACDRSRCCVRLASPTARVSPWPHQLRRWSKTTWCLARGSVQLLRKRELAGYRRRRCHRMRVHPTPRRRRPMRHRPYSRRRLLSRHRARGLQTRPRSLARRPSRASVHRSRVRARTLQQQPQSRPRQVWHQARLRLRRRPLLRLLQSKCRKRRPRQSARARARQPLRQLPLRRRPLQLLLLLPRLQLLLQLPTLRRLLAALRRRRLPRRRLPKPSRVRQRRWFRSRRSNSQNDPQQSTQQSIQNESAPDFRGAPSTLPTRRYLLRSRQAAFTSTLASTTLPLPIGIWRGFLASGISRTRSTCSRPFCSEAPFTWTKSASWNTRSNARAAMPW
jgi:hypothetical protein